MSTDTLIACARCASKAESRRVLERHLVEHHLLAAAAAQVEAELSARSCPGCGRSSGAHNKACPARRTWTPPAVTVPVTPPAVAAATTKETPMADEKSCGLCRMTKSGKCKRHGGAGSTGGGHKARKKEKKSKPVVREAVALNGANSARKAGQTFLDQLHRLRAELDEKITDVESLVGIL